MKTTFTLLFIAFISMGVCAQYGLPVDFENPDEVSSWIQIANAGDLPENMVMAANPAKDGINPSDSCLKLVILDAADPWAGAWTEAYGNLPVTQDHHIMEMMVYKGKTSPCGLKLEAEGGGNPIEVKVNNTKTGEWELLAFDFSEKIGTTFKRLVFFPDFPESRTAGGTAYIDNIQYVGGWTSVREVYGIDITVYPNPTADILTVKYPGMDRITVSNVVGQAVRSFELQKVDFTRLDVADLAAGVYFLTLESDQGKVSSKFVKE